MRLNFTYDLSAHRILHDREVRSRLTKMRSAGVETIFVFGYFYGHMESPEEEIAKARCVLEDEGFRTGVINLPCGHGGNALDPNDETLRLEIGDRWRMRADDAGQLYPTAACIEEKMIADSRAANEAFRQMGYRRLICDDDLRLGPWGKTLRGCFCDRCMAEFSELAGRTIARAEIMNAKNSALRAQWMDFQCAKVTRFLTETTPRDMQGGVMVMHNGDRRHGIDIPAIRAATPEDFMLRVGEAHFDDAAFLDPRAQASLEASILTHLTLFGDDARCYSESTVFPANALSPENWIRKMEIEIRCGLRNLFLMSGTWFFTDPYWDMLERELPRLTELAHMQPLPHEVRDFIWQM